MPEIAHQEPNLAWQLYEQVTSTDILRQGDLIRFESGTSAWHYGIVATADCDLDNRKHSRLVTLVPFVTVEEIICKCLAFDFFDFKAKELRAKCRSLLKISTPSDDATFIGSVKAYVRDGNYESRLHELVARVTANELAEVEMNELREVVEFLGMTWRNVLQRRFKEQIVKRGDLLLLIKPPLVSETPTIAWLRAIWQEPLANIALRTSEDSRAKGIRVAQLKSPYRYRLTQMLGSVFADVGLPDLPHEQFDHDVSLLES